jgi:hypothetical protein
LRDVQHPIITFWLGSLDGLDAITTTSGDRCLPADWVVEGVGAFASGVKGLLPSGFESYARILHPAWPSGAAAQEGSTPQPVPWRVVAAAAGAEMHRRVQFESLVGAGRGERREYAPDEGELPMTTLTALCAVLRTYTGTPEHCWFCLWEGWGWIEGSARIITSTHGSFDAPPAFPPKTLDGPRVSLPHRDYLLFEGPLAAATELGWRIGELMGSAYPEVGFDSEEFQPQSPNLASGPILVRRHRDRPRLDLCRRFR